MKTEDNLPSWRQLMILVVIHVVGVGLALAIGQRNGALLFMLLLGLVLLLVGARAERTRNAAEVAIARLDCRELIQEHATLAWKRGDVVHSDAINDVLADFDRRWPPQWML